MNKTCTLCKRELPETKFYTMMQRGKIRLDSRCKNCRRGGKGIHVYLVYDKPVKNKMAIYSKVRKRLDSINQRFPLRIVDGSGEIPVWDWLHKPLPSTEFNELVMKEELTGITPVGYYQYENPPWRWPPNIDDVMLDYKGATT